MSELQEKVTINSIEDFNNYLEKINDNDSYGIEMDKMSFLQTNFPEARTEKEAFNHFKLKLPVILELDSRGNPRSYKSFIKSIEDFNNYFEKINDNNSYGIEMDKMSFLQTNFPEARTEKEALNQLELELPVVLEIDNKGILRSFKSFNQNLALTKNELKKHSKLLGEKINQYKSIKNFKKEDASDSYIEALEAQKDKIDSQLKELKKLSKSKTKDIVR